MEPPITVTAPATAGVLTGGGLGGFGGGGPGGLELPVRRVIVKENTMSVYPHHIHSNADHKGESHSQGANSELSTPANMVK